MGTYILYQLETFLDLDYYRNSPKATLMHPAADYAILV